MYYELEFILIQRMMAYMNKIIALIKKDPMLPVAATAALISLLITPPSLRLLSDIDWHTLGTLFMMLTVLEGFKKENIFHVRLFENADVEKPVV